MELINGLELVMKLKGDPSIKMAQTLNVSKQAVSKWINDDKPIPKERLKQLSVIYGVPLDIFQKDFNEQCIEDILRYIVKL